MHLLAVLFTEFAKCLLLFLYLSLLLVTLILTTNHINYNGTADLAVHLQQQEEPAPEQLRVWEEHPGLSADSSNKLTQSKP